MIHPLIKALRYEHWADLNAICAGTKPKDGFVPVHGFVLVVEVDRSTEPDVYATGAGLDSVLVLEIEKAALKYLDDVGLSGIVRFLRIVHHNTCRSESHNDASLNMRLKRLEEKLFPADPSIVDHMGCL